MAVQNLLDVARTLLLVALAPDASFIIFSLEAFSPTLYTPTSYFDARTHGFGCECHVD